MITNKEDYLKYLHEDRIANGNPKTTFLRSLFIYSEHLRIMKYLRILRRMEYLTNINKGFIEKISFAITTYRYHKMSYKLGIWIPVNTVGYGLKMYHIGNTGIGFGTTLGNNCTLQKGVMVGPTTPGKGPIVGDDVYFAPGAKVFGNIKIGNNVIVAPNSVVIKDIPDNCVVSGVPAKIIKLNGKKVTEPVLQDPLL
ncbi:MAG TPA: hypothetical protein VGM63_03470 [Mucilaginibacter sp.]